MENLAIYTDEERRRALAYWYEGLARHLLRIAIPSWNDWNAQRAVAHYDFEDGGLRALVEVKGSSNADVLLLFVDQLTAHIGELGFPVEDGFLWIFSYRNRGSKKRDGSRGSGGGRRLFARTCGKSWEEVSTFLAANTTHAHVVHMQLLNRLLRRYGSRPYQWERSYERSLLRINRGTLDRLADDFRTASSELGLSDADLVHWLPPRAKRIRPRFIETKLADGNVVRFRLVPLLPNGLKNRFLLKLNGTVKKNLAQ